jgi:capsular polysaccharide biosynthesis protein
LGTNTPLAAAIIGFAFLLFNNNALQDFTNLGKMEQSIYSTPKEIHFMEYVDIIWQRRIYVLIPLIILPTVMLVYIMLAPREFKTQTSIFIDESYFNHPTLQDYNIKINLEDRLPTIEQQLLSDENLYDSIVADADALSETDSSIPAFSFDESVKLNYLGPGLVSISVTSKDPYNAKRTLDRATNIYLKYALEPTRGVGKKLLERIKQRDRILISQIIPKFNDAKYKYQDAKKNFTEQASELMFAKEEYENWLEKLRQQERIAQESLNDILPLKGEDLDRDKIVQIVLPSFVPLSPFKPQKKKLLTLSLLAALAAGGLLVYIRQFLDHSFRTPNEVEQALAIPVIGRIPKLWEDEPNGKSKTQPDDLNQGKEPQDHKKRKALGADQKIRQKKFSVKHLIYTLIAILIFILVFVSIGVTLSTSGNPSLRNQSLKNDTISHLGETLMAHSRDQLDKEGNLKLSLNQRDINALSNLLNSKTNVAAVQCALLNNHLFVSASVQFMKRPFSRYLNLQTDLSARWNQETLELYVHSLKLGVLPIPGFISTAMVNRFLLPRMIKELDSNKNINEFFTSIRSIKVHNRQLEIVYKGDFSIIDAFALQGGTSTAQFTRNEKEEVLVVYRTITDLVNRLSKKDDQFKRIMEHIFQQASRLTDQGMGAVTANKLVLSSLGLYFGDPTLVKVLDPTNSFQAEHQIASRYRDQSKIYNRSDWARHFSISAMLTAVFGKDTANQIGIDKEVKDFNRSGFSFQDLLADRSGVFFAEQCLQDETTAYETQREIQRGFRIQAFFPEKASLPKNMNQNEFNLIYGTVKSPEFKLELDKIDQLISNVTGFRPLNNL